MILIREAYAREFIIISNFQEKLALETENVRLNSETVKKGVKAVFEDPTKGCYYVAEFDGEIVGCLLTTYEWSDWRNGYIIWIQSVYVAPAARMKRVFKNLYHHIKQIAEGNPDYMGIRLYVDKTNETAIEVYRLIGMSDEHYKTFEWISAT